MSTTTEIKNQVVQNVTDGNGRGYSNGDSLLLGNFTKEITYNVTLGYSAWGHYKRLSVVKFATIQDAMEYLVSLGSQAQTTSFEFYEKYFSLTKQEGCVFSTIGFFTSLNQ